MTISELEAKLCGQMLEDSDKLHERGLSFQRDMDLILLKMTYELSGKDLPPEAKVLLDKVFFKEVKSNAENEPIRTS